MVLEAVAAVSLASAVVQFVHFTTKVASKSREYHTIADGAIKEHIQLGDYADSFARLGERLENSKASLPGRKDLSVEERALLDVAQRCQSICRGITDTLSGLVKSGNNRKFASFRQALKAVWSEDKIESNLQKLRDAKQDLVVNLLVVAKSAALLAP